MNEMNVRLKPTLRAVPPALCAAIALALAPALAAPPAASNPPADGKGKAAASPSATDAVARVNGHPILRRDFDLAVQMQFRARRNPVTHKELQAAREMILEKLIEQELIYQKAPKSASFVADKEVDAELGRIKQGFPSESAFAAALKQNGVGDAEFKEQILRSLIVRRFVDREVVGDVKVSDEDVRRTYDQNASEMTRKESVRLAEILVRVPPDATAEDRANARLKIEEILKQARGGEAFADLARKYSDGPEASRGGDTGWLARGQAPPAIDHAAFALQAGQTSDVVESRLGYHILKVAEKRPEGPIPFDEAKDSIRAKLVARARDEKIRAYVAGLKETARVERGSKTTP
jgi:parvulin-like peptidyl-prolyl isomerase